MILVTGAEGLIGRHICAVMKAAGVDYRPFDIRRSSFEDVRNSEAVTAALKGVRGIIHLAAVSRVAWGERDPGLCEAVNVRALQGLLGACLEGHRPWVVFASSREVYGQPHSMPVREDAPRQAMNHYARSKHRGELLVEAAAQAGLRANICRFSSVYGCPHDHVDRVAMAFALAAAGRSDRIFIEGAGNTFDFTSVREVADGLWRLVQATDSGESLPPIHLVSGRGTTLGELAQMAADAAVRDFVMQDAAPRSYDVSRFIGDPSRAFSLIGWAARSDLKVEFARLVDDLRLAAPAPRAMSLSQ
jgi:nucleoside-diphosphate-sugar epimerase